MPPGVARLPAARPEDGAEVAALPPAGREAGAPVVPAAGRYVLASWGARAGALAIDTAIVLLLAALLTLVWGGLLGVPAEDSAALEVLAWVLIGFVALIVATVIYAPTVVALTRGRTAGKALLGLRVLRTDGRPVGYWWGMLREVVVKGIIIGALGLLTLGVAWLLDGLWPLWDAERRALHDIVCRTRVVRIPRGR